MDTLTPILEPIKALGVPGAVLVCAGLLFRIRLDLVEGRAALQQLLSEHERTCATNYARKDDFDALAGRFHNHLENHKR